MLEPWPHLEQRLRRRAARLQLELTDQAIAELAAHARSVLHANAELHLTAITQPEQFIERHIGEALEGAAMLEQTSGLLVDLGSGNGYPGIPIAVARPQLRLLMVEASRRKAAFLRTVASSIGSTHCEVLEAQVQRAADIAAFAPIRVLVTRAVEVGEKILPRLVGSLDTDGEMLVWAGSRVGEIIDRKVWRRLRIVERRPLPGLDHAWIWRLRASGASA